MTMLLASRRGPALALALLALGGCAAVRSRLPGAHGETTAASALAPLPDDGMTSATHRRYVGQIVFASEPIDAAAPDESRLASEFFADEPLFARVFLARSLENEPVFVEGNAKPMRNRGLGYFYKLTVDGAPVPYQVETGNVSRADHATTTRALSLHPVNAPTSRGWVELVNGLSQGRHVLRFELWTRDGSFVGRSALAAGELVLHKEAGIATGRTFEDVAAGLTDPELAKQLLEIARGHATKEAWKDQLTDLKITSREWSFIYDRVPVRKLVAKEIATSVRSEWPDGHCTAQTIVFYQRLKIDRSPTGPIGVKGVGDQSLIDCTASVVVSGDRWAGKTRARPTPTTAETKTAETKTRTETETETKTETKTAETKTVATSVAAAPRTSTRATMSATETIEPTASRAGRFSIGLGGGTNGLDPSGVATYANVGVHLGRFELGAGATWPLDAFGYVRVAVIDGRFELSPMLAVSVLAEQHMDTRVAFAGGASLAVTLVRGAIAAGLRLDVLASFDAGPGELTVPVLGSTFVRF